MTAPYLTTEDPLCECGDPRSEHDAGIASCGMCPCEEFVNGPTLAFALAHIRTTSTSSGWRTVSTYREEWRPDA